jgi:regulator of RNase E activity RraA
VHKGLGLLGCVTDGSIRDIDQWAPGFQVLAGSIGPSHAHVHLADFGKEVRVAGMVVRSGDIVHADRHGAVTIPEAMAAKLPAACDLLARKEAVILEMARAPGFNVAKLREALAKQDEIH